MRGVGEVPFLFGDPKDLRSAFRPTVHLEEFPENKRVSALSGLALMGQSLA